MSLNTSILLIEDNVKLANLITRYITPHGYTVEHKTNAADIDEIKEMTFDLILCDVMLPDGNGFALFPKLRAVCDAPIIFLTALTDVKDEIKGLELGAVDYVTKPVHPQLLLARIRANLREAPREYDCSTLAIGDSLVLDKTAETVTYQEQLLNFTHNEFELFWIYAQYKDRPLTREFIFNALMKREYDGLDRTIDARTMRLRKKLQSLAIPGLSIRTVWGKGYVLAYEPPVSVEHNL